MPIFPIHNNKQITPQIKYRRMLNRLNLQTREKIADVEMFYPFETAEKKDMIKSILDWKEASKQNIYNRCFNSKPSSWENLINFLDRIFNL